MLNRLLPCCALLAMISVPFAYSQNTNPSTTGDGQSQQNTTGCTDETLAAGADCSQNQQQNPQVNPYGETGVPTPGRMGTVQPEGAATSDQARLREQQRQLQQLPPDLPTEFQKFVGETTGQFLKIYGEDLFRQVPSTFAPSDQVPVPPEYVIGPDDELRVRIWGQISFSGNLRVDRSGNVYLPQVGTVQVAGLRFSDVDQHLRAAVAKIYRNFDLSVDIGRIRSMQIYVSGQARRPGAYTISSLSSLVDALFASGGPSPQGSLRHVLLKREGKTVTDFDLYALLVRGDKSKDVRLLPEDVIFIPPAGPEVAITGSVRNPAIYELRIGETVGDLVEMAGKTTAVASNSRITLERVEEHQLRDVIQVDFNAAGLATTLDDGDILRIDPILPAYDKVVTLRGNVANPGRFGWHAGMRLSDLIPDVDSLVSRDYWWKRSHLGLPAPEFEPGISTLGENQSQYQNQNQNQQSANSSLGGNRLPSQTNNTQTTDTTAITPQSSLTNALTPQDQTSSDLSQSGNTSSAQRGSNATLAAEVTRPSNNGSTQSPQRNRVTLPNNEIDWSYAVIERVDPNSLKPSLITFDLGKLVLDHDAAANLELQPGDTVTIFSQADIRESLGKQTKYVDLEGEFVHPGYYSVGPGESLRDIVRMAGGLTPQAYLYGSEFTRESARVLQQQRLDDYIRSMTLDAERGNQALMLSPSASGGSSDLAASRSLTQDFIARLNQLTATGRIVLRFDSTSSKIEDIPEISLENGDKFVVPYAPANVNVVGAVYDQNSFLFQHGRTLAYYLRLAGGANRNADWGHAFLVRADGSVMSRTHSGESGFWKESFTDVRLNPGDTIVVPDKTLRPTALRSLIDWSQVFSQLALGAAAIQVLK
jgi:protein involved in polysaccharide export with SLBB domain